MRKARAALAVAVAGAIVSLPLTVGGCDKTESRSKETTVQTKETPAGTTKTTTTEEKKVESNPK